jgi:outer membrane receptor protein involved in Fe transport
MLTLGASADFIDDGADDSDALNPKLGIVWRAGERVAVRAAVFETLEGSITASKQTPQPRLEPVQVAGFNQFLLAANGDIARVHGAGVDVEISDRVFAGAEIARREFERPVRIVGPDAGDFQASGSETWQRAYFYWAPNDQLSFNAQYQYDRLNNAEQPLFGFTHMRTQRLPLEVRYFAAAGLSVGVRASRVHQDGSFVTPVTGPLDEFAPGEDSFWTVDASLGYRLPNRRGVLSFNVNNLFDEEFQFQDIDWENPSIMPDRLAYLRFTMAFE